MKDLAFRKYVAREVEFAFYESQTYFLLIQFDSSHVLKNVDYGPSLLKIAIFVDYYKLLFFSLLKSTFFNLRA